MIVLTPNRRLTAFSTRIYNAKQSKVCSAWVSPEIFPIDVWLLQLWQLSLDYNLGIYKPLLTPKQQQILFEQIIQANGATENLLRINATANNALQAWSFLCQWQIQFSEIIAYKDYNPDVSAFCNWMQTFFDWLNEHGFIDFNQMVQNIINNLDKFKDFIPKQICLRGFNELIPVYDTLFTKLSAYGVEITYDSLTENGAKVSRIGLKDSDDEIKVCGQWLVDNIDDEKIDSIGIVIPDLSERRDYISNFFAGICQQSMINISAPKPLASFGVINTALNILNLTTKIINYEDFSAILRSPFIAQSNEVNSNSRLDRLLRDRVEAKCSLQQILQYIPDEHNLHAKLTVFSNKLGSSDSKHEPIFWAKHIQELLNSLGWPGSGLRTNVDNLNKTQADLLSCWQDLLTEYCSLVTVLPKHSFAKAIQYIWRLAKETPFLPAESGKTKVHILGLLEAEGLFFDKLWVCGMSREQWPKLVSPNPFIPREIQRAYDLPHNCAERELIMARKYTANLELGAKKDVVFSYPLSIDDNVTTASNLIAHLPEIEYVLPISNNSYQAVEELVDENNIDLASAYVSGGAKVLQLQAQCPFRANAYVRFKAKPLNITPNALTPMLRGNIVHMVLEEFWRKCLSHAELLSLQQKDVESMLNDIIQKTLLYWQQKFPNIFNANNMMLESERLYSLILRWLEYEKKRQPFVVSQIEQKSEVKIGPMQINVQVDRVDQTENGLVIIDYKTGSVSVSNWFPVDGKAILEPQLPIYAVFCDFDTVGVVFAILKAQELRFRGVIGIDGILPDVIQSDDWDKDLQNWRDNLLKTAKDFIAGLSSVSPVDGACKTCNLHALCRVYEH